MEVILLRRVERGVLKPLSIPIQLRRQLTLKFRKLTITAYDISNILIPVHLCNIHL